MAFQRLLSGQRKSLVRKGGLEPPQGESHKILSLGGSESNRREASGLDERSRHADG